MSIRMTKPAKWDVQPAESLLFAQRVVKDPRFLHTDSKDSDQTSHFKCFWFTVMILCFRTDRSGQTVQTQIRLLLEMVKPSCQNFRVITANCSGLVFLWDYIFCFIYILNYLTLRRPLTLRHLVWVTLFAKICFVVKIWKENYRKWS